MKATDAIRIVRQTAQPPGQPAQTTTEEVCPKCFRRVGPVKLTAAGEPYRAHEERLPDGTLCDYGRTERDPVGTLVAF
jgi:hypothetical protein